MAPRRARVDAIGGSPTRAPGARITTRRDAMGVPGAVPRHGTGRGEGSAGGPRTGRFGGHPPGPTTMNRPAPPLRWRRALSTGGGLQARPVVSCRRGLVGRGPDSSRFVAAPNRATPGPGRPGGDLEPASTPGPGPQVFGTGDGALPRPVVAADARLRRLPAASPGVDGVRRSSRSSRPFFPVTASGPGSRRLAAPGQAETVRGRARVLSPARSPGLRTAWQCVPGRGRARTHGRERRVDGVPGRELGASLPGTEVVAREPGITPMAPAPHGGTGSTGAPGLVPGSTRSGVYGLGSGTEPFQ